jgi:hypothetical protein
MARSILGTVGLALTLAFAIPVALLGLDLLSRGQTNQGLLFLGIAALMVAIEEYLTTPMDVPGMVAGKLLGSAVKEPDEDDGEDVAVGDAEGESRSDAGDGDEEVLVPDAEEGRREE